MTRPKLPETKVNIPMPEVKPPKEDFMTEINWRYQEKCKEVDRLELLVEGQKALLEERSKELERMKEEARTGDLISREAALKAVRDAKFTLFNIPQKVMKYADEILSQFEYRQKVTEELIEAIPAVSSSSTIRELAAEPLKGFIPNVEPPEELPECLLGETVTAQDILCLSSALKNLFEIHKCDSFTLYCKLSRVLEKKIEEYCKVED